MTATTGVAVRDGSRGTESSIVVFRQRTGNRIVVAEEILGVLSWEGRVAAEEDTSGVAVVAKGETSLILRWATEGTRLGRLLGLDEGDGDGRE